MTSKAEQLLCEATAAWRTADPKDRSDSFEEEWLAQRLADALAEVERLREQCDEEVTSNHRMLAREALWRELWALRTSERRFEHMDRLHELVRLLGLNDGS